MAKQNFDAYAAGSGSFQEIFAQIVSKVGSNVNAANLSKDAAEAQKNATAEAEAQFSGVSLDTEAANLIEQQQAYQASARICKLLEIYLILYYNQFNKKCKLVRNYLINKL